MHRRMVRQALRLGLLVTLVVLVLSACGGGQEEADKPRPLPEEEKALRPGQYRSEEFRPPFSFRVGKGWSTYTREAPEVLRFSYGQVGGLGFTNIHEVFKPTRTGTPNVVEAPEDIVGWFRGHPYLETTEPKSATVGGVEGVQFDAIVEDLPEGYQGVCLGITGAAGADCVDIAKFGDDQILAHPKVARVRYIVLEDVEGETVTVYFGSPTAEFDKFLPEARKVLDSVKWRGT
jgi:hypothetical protein